jgi:hypothetical protein
LASLRGNSSKKIAEAQPHPAWPPARPLIGATTLDGFRAGPLFAIVSNAAVALYSLCAGTLYGVTEKIQGGTQ